MRRAPYRSRTWLRRGTFVGAGVAALSLAVFGLTARHEIHGLTLVLRAADVQGVVRRVSDLDAVSVKEHLVSIPLEGASIRARVYAPTTAPQQTVLLVSGLNPMGIDEPRLVRLARRLAEAGVTVVTPDIPELSRFEISPLLTDRIEQSAAWLATQSGLAMSHRIGLIGVSFSGGLAVVAAGRPSLHDHLLYVLSFGGHDDLRRVLEYYCAGGQRFARLPHDYGVAVVLLNVAGHLVPPEQLGSLRSAVLRFLRASYTEQFDAAQAGREFAALGDLADALPEPAAGLLRSVNARDVAQLGPKLLPYIGPYADAAALSPSRSPSPSVPLFLLHGREDNVIPASESSRLADRLREQVPVRLLLTDVISHAEVDRPPRAMDVLRLAWFWGDVLQAHAAGAIRSTARGLDVPDAVSIETQTRRATGQKWPPAPTSIGALMVWLTTHRVPSRRTLDTGAPSNSRARDRCNR